MSIIHQIYRSRKKTARTLSHQTAGLKHIVHIASQGHNTHKSNTATLGLDTSNLAIKLREIIPTIFKARSRGTRTWRSRTSSQAGPPLRPRLRHLHHRHRFTLPLCPLRPRWNPKAVGPFLRSEEPRIQHGHTRS